MSEKKRKIIISLAVAFGIILIIAGLLFYYQKQGMIKIFPTKEEKEIAKILEIDREKLRPAQDLSQEDFEKIIKELEKEKENVLSDPKSATVWHEFAILKNFLNDHQGAVEAWEMSFEIQPNNFRTALNLANTCQYFVKDYPKAEYYYRKVLELQPQLTSAFDGLMDLYRYNYKEKQSEYEPLVLQGIENDQANAAAYYSSLIGFFMSEETSNEEKAVKYWEKLNSIDSVKAEAAFDSYPKLKELVEK